MIDLEDRFVPRSFGRLAISLSMLLGSGCGRGDLPTRPASPAPPSAPPGAMAPGPTAQDPRAAVDARGPWLERAARVLRNGEGLGPNDDLAHLASMSREAAVDELMNDARLADAVMDFSLYFLGYRGVPVRRPDGALNYFSFPGNPGFAAHPSAAAATREFSRNGDYLVLFSLAQPTLAPPLPVPVSPFFGGSPAGTSTRSIAEVNREAHDGWIAALDALAAMPPEVRSATAASAACRLLVAPGLLSFPIAVTGLAVPALGPDPISDQVVNLCFARPALPFDLGALIAALRGRVEGAYGYAVEFDQEGYEDKLLPPGDGAPLPFTERVRSPLRAWTDFHEYDPARLRLAPATAYSPAIWGDLPNSSTNHDRKRAAYILDRYFCDDLKPIDAALPEVHGTDQHASDPSCRTCHYKLDPMAGFFKDIGVGGSSFEGQRLIVFDDGAWADREDYVRAWRSPPGAAHPWNVGYVRSATDHSRNDYGESLADLHAIIARAPEAKRCLVQRLFEYVLGQDQAVDPGYIDALAATFTEDAKTSSAQALRRTLRTLLLSAAFTADDRRADECYDLPPGATAAHRPPCQVASILQKNCATCHAGSGAQAGLDVTTWGPGAAGIDTFGHVDSGGHPIAPRETLTRMLDRLSTADPARSMPLGRFMSARERETLVEWIDQRLDEIGGAR